VGTEKLMARIFDGPQIGRLSQEKYFPLTMTTLEKMFGDPLQQLWKTSSEILKLLNIKTFKNSC